MIIRGKKIGGVAATDTRYICEIVQNSITTRVIFEKCDDANSFASAAWNGLTETQKRKAVIKVVRVFAGDLEDKAFADWLDSKIPKSERRVNWKLYRHADTTSRCFDSTR